MLNASSLFSGLYLSVINPTCPSVCQCFMSLVTRQHRPALLCSSQRWEHPPIVQLWCSGLVKLLSLDTRQHHKCTYNLYQGHQIKYFIDSISQMVRKWAKSRPILMRQQGPRSDDEACLSPCRSCSGGQPADLTNCSKINLNTFKVETGHNKLLLH